MMSRNLHVRVRRFAGAGIALAFILAAQAAEASSITFISANVWRADRTANPIGFPSLALVPWVEVSTTGNVADTTVTASSGSLSLNLTRIAGGALSGLYFAQTPYDTSLTGDWTITATNTTTFTDSVTQIRPAFIPVDAMPFVENIGFTGTGTDITVHWDVSAAGAARLDQQQVTIWDITTPGSFFTAQFFGIGSAPRQVTLTNLQLGRLYAVEINQVDINANGYTDAFSGNWLSGWTTTQGEVQLPPPSPVPEPASMTLLLTGLAGAGVRRWRQRRKSNTSPSA